MKLPTLYKKSNTGAMLFWEISVEETHLGFNFGLGEITVKHGQLGTDSPQINSEIIKEGKNTGKKNATTALQQAEAEGQAQWTKQKKKGYVESKEAAEAGELDALIEGGKEPMLAHSYMDVIYDVRPGHELDPPRLVKTKEAKKMVFPLYVQPKLDGIRSTSQADEERSLWSRTRKKQTSMPHIQKELRLLMAGSTKENDGELYNHAFKADFEKIVSIVRKDAPEEGYLNVQYHMYDIIMDGPFSERIEHLANLIHSYEKVNGELKYIRLVETVMVNNDEELLEVFKNFRKKGYEGAMVRNTAGPYVFKRSYDLQKFKEFMEDDFEIVGIKEGRGKLAGHVGTFTCKLKTENNTENGTVEVKLEGDTSYLKTCFEDHSQWKGKKLTVVYQGYTVDKSLRIPVGKVIRDYE